MLGLPLLFRTSLLNKAYVDGTLEDLVKEEGGRVESDLRLRKILVAHKDDYIHVTVLHCTVQCYIHVTRAKFDNLKTGTTEPVDVRSLEVTSL